MDVFTVLLLLVVVQGSIGFMVSNTFNTQNICDSQYGIILQSAVKRNAIACSGICSRDVSCLSFIYNPLTGQCNTNNYEIPHAFSNCSMLVKYGSKYQPLSSTPTISVSTTNIPYTGPTHLYGSYNGDTCEIISDCVEPLSECRDGRCQCLESYVYKYRTKSCVFITECGLLGTSFQTIEEREHRLPFVDEIVQISESDCVSLCVTATNYTCRLISYDRRTQTCGILDFNGFTMLDIADKYDPEVDSIVYQRDCTNSLSTMHRVCTYDTDCVERHSECVSSFGKCGCQVGLSYDRDRRVCVKECSLYSKFGLQRHHAMRIVGFMADDEMYPIFTREDCRDACFSNTNINCVSAMLDNILNVCFMSHQTLAIYPPMNFVSDPMFDLLQKDCESMVPMLENTYCYYSGCSVPESECRDGVCKCKVGLSFDKFSNTCTDVCNNNGHTFQTINNFYVDFPSMVSLPVVSSDPFNECKATCVMETSFQCRMAVLDIPIWKCILFEIALIDIPVSAYVNDMSGFVTFQRDCT